MALASFGELLSIGAILPFLAVLTAPEAIFHHPLAQPAINFLGLTAPQQILLPVTIGFGMAASFAASVRLLLLWANTRLSFATGAEVGIDIYRRTLYQPYAIHLARNSSEIISGIATKTNSVIHVIGLSLNLISAAMMLVTILVGLFFIDSVIALAAIGAFGAIYGVIIWVTRARQLANSERIARESTQVVKSLQEGLGGIRDILLTGNQEAYCGIYRRAEVRSRTAQASSAFIAASPRYAMEGFGMVLIASLAYALVQQADGVTRAIPVLGALALGAQRVLPILQQAYGAWSGIQGEQFALRDILDLLHQPLPDYAHSPGINASPYSHEISLRQVSFRYSDDTPWVIEDINLKIPKGSRVGFIGMTGSGKSTLIDIIMGLLQPTEGHLAVDGEVITKTNCRSWQAQVAHVPQTIFLADTSIAENIAFGQPANQIDHDRVRWAAQQAQIDHVIETWPRKYQTLVGERGMRLSGGQRQRIGIARALYYRPSVLVLDEATSALDTETEGAVMRAIESFGNGLTVIIVAHRVTTLRNCTFIVELGRNRIIRAGTYYEMIASEAKQ